MSKGIPCSALRTLGERCLKKKEMASAEMREVAARRTRQTANAKRESHRFLDLLPIVLLHLIDRDDANGPGRLAQLVRAQR